MSGQRILVLIRGHVADVVTAFPALRDLRRDRPGAHIAVMVNEYVRDAFDHCPYVDEVITGFLYHRRQRPARIRHHVSVLLQIAARFDVVLALHNSPPSSPLLALVAGAKDRLGYAGPGPLRLLLSDQLGHEPDDSALRVRNMRIVEALGVGSTPDYSPIDWLPESVLDRVTRLLTAHGLPPGTSFAVLQMSCNWGCNEWATHKWAEIVDFLAEEQGLVPVATGTNDRPERAKFDRVQALARTDIVSLHGKTSLPQLFEVVRRASIVVATDSALTQVTLAQRTPAVVMWGIEPIAPNGPLPDEAGTAFEAVQHWEGALSAPPPNPLCAMQGFGPPVSSCHSPNCCENSSLSRTTVDEVKARVRRVLSRAKAASA